MIRTSFYHLYEWNFDAKQQKWKKKTCLHTLENRSRGMRHVNTHFFHFEHSYNSLEYCHTLAEYISNK